MMVVGRHRVASGLLLLGLGFGMAGAPRAGPVAGRIRSNRRRLRRGPAPPPPLDAPRTEVEALPSSRPAAVRVREQSPSRETEVDVDATDSPTRAGVRDARNLRRRSPSVVREIGPAAKAVWTSGYWEWDADGDRFVWVAGSWQVPPAGTVWVAGRWMHDAGGWYWVPGAWGRRANRPAIAANRPAWRTSGPPGRTT